MTKVLRCATLFSGCAAEVRAETEEEVLRQAAQHAREAHAIDQMDEATIRQVKAAIRTEP